MEAVQSIRQALDFQKRVRGKKQLVHLLAGQIMAVVALADSDGGAGFGLDEKVIEALKLHSGENRAEVLAGLAERTNQVIADLAMGSGPLEPERKVMILADQAWHLCEFAEAKQTGKDLPKPPEAKLLLEFKG